MVLQFWTTHLEHETFIFKNRSIFKKFISLSVLMSSQAIHFRGHRDSEKLFEKQSFGQNEGNCNSFMLNASHNATYISPEYQLKFIKHSARKIVLRILNRVRTSQIFSISFDVTTDASGKNILSMVVRYVDAETDEIHEDFLGLE